LLRCGVVASRPSSKSLKEAFLKLIEQMKGFPSNVMELLRLLRLPS
jgi:hypothetical protein